MKRWVLYLVVLQCVAISVYGTNDFFQKKISDYYQSRLLTLFPFSNVSQAQYALQISPQNIYLFEFPCDNSIEFPIRIKGVTEDYKKRFGKYAAELHNIFYVSILKHISNISFYFSNEKVVSVPLHILNCIFRI